GASVTRSGAAGRPIASSTPVTLRSGRTSASAPSPRTSGQLSERTTSATPGAGGGGPGRTGPPVGAGAPACERAASGGYGPPVEDGAPVGDGAPGGRGRSDGACGTGFVVLSTTLGSGPHGRVRPDARPSAPSRAARVRVWPYATPGSCRLRTDARPEARS